MSTHREYLDLCEEVLHHDYLYYVECKPKISDREYDRLMKLIEEIEKKHPEWVTSTSPTQRVGEASHTGFKQGTHKVPMLSIANTYSRDEVEAFVHRVHKLLEKKNIVFLRRA